MNVITDEKIKMCERILKNKIKYQKGKRKIVCIIKAGNMKKTLYGYLK